MVGMQGKRLQDRRVSVLCGARTFTLGETRGGAAAARRRSVREDGCLGALTMVIVCLEWNRMQLIR